MRGDTLKDVFVLQSATVNGGKAWNITGIKCKYLSPAPPPFPIKTALAAFNRHLDSVSTLKGRPPASDGHLGPLFMLIRGGDPGRLLTALPDGEYWYFDHLTGSGDCPAGCTQHTEDVYRVNPTGNVQLVSTKDFFALCFPSEIRGRTGIAAKPKVDGRCFTADGKAVEETPAIRRNGARLLRSGDVKR